MPAVVTCVIGAGPSGLTAAKALQDNGVPFDCFERSGRVGGLWAFGNPRGTPTAYRSLRSNTSKARTELEDLPMPVDYPDHPTQFQIGTYFEDYAERFGLRDRITFDTAVERAELDGSGSWKVSLEGGETRVYDALIVANGHHSDPLWPDPPFPGHFDGTVIHARDYVDPQGLEGKTVVVVGIGNSAMDIAVDVSQVAARTVLSTRRGAHILPRRLLGRPLDQIETMVPGPLRPALGGRLTGLALRAGHGLGRIPKPQQFGLPAPDHPPSAEHPTVSDEIFERIAAGAIVAKPNVAELAGGEIRFQDGASERADLLIYATGYRVSFPFLEPELTSAAADRLFHRIFHPVIRSLFFIGLVQPIGPTIRLVEAQSKWVAAHLAGAYDLPSREQMERAIATENRAQAPPLLRVPPAHDGSRFLAVSARDPARAASRGPERSDEWTVKPPPCPSSSPRTRWRRFRNLSRTFAGRPQRTSSS